MSLSCLLSRTYILVSIVCPMQPPPRNIPFFNIPRGVILLLCQKSFRIKNMKRKEECQKFLKNKLFMYGMNKLLHDWLVCTIFIMHLLGNLPTMQ